jgi:hypothetical protein
MGCFVLSMFAVKDDDQGTAVRMAKIAVLVSYHLKWTIHGMQGGSVGGRLCR